MTTKIEVAQRPADGDPVFWSHRGDAGGSWKGVPAALDVLVKTVPMNKAAPELHAATEEQIKADMLAIQRATGALTKTPHHVTRATPRKGNAGTAQSALRQPITPEKKQPKKRGRPPKVAPPQRRERSSSVLSSIVVDVSGSAADPKPVPKKRRR